MPDHAISAHPGVQAQLDRLATLSPGADMLGLDRITRLLDRLGNPQDRLPPVFHVAGTNGKGSTCAFLRAAIEATGRPVHVYSSPHLVRFNERIRVAGQLIGDEPLAALLGEVLDQAAGIDASFFEVTTAAAFLAFSRTPAAATIVEVGLGGRLDATNVIRRPAVTGIAALGVDHQAFLGNTLEAIAGEKAGIAKPGVALVTMNYLPPIASRVRHVAETAGARLIAHDRDWSSAAETGAVHYQDHAGELALPLPALAGAFQAENYALAVAMLRHQDQVAVDPAAIRQAALTARWSARLQRLGEGPMLSRLHAAGGNADLLVDGAHNVSAAAAVADAWRSWAADKALIVGMLANKDAAAVIPLLLGAGVTRMIGVPVPGHEHHAPDRLAALAEANGALADMATSLDAAIDRLGRESRNGSVLIAGSLYLAGEALRLNDQAPQ